RAAADKNVHVYRRIFPSILHSSLKEHDGRGIHFNPGPDSNYWAIRYVAAASHPPGVGGIEALAPVANQYPSRQFNGAFIKVQNSYDFIRSVPPSDDQHAFGFEAEYVHFGFTQAL